MRLVTDWFKRTFSDPQIVFLSLALLTSFGIILSMGDMLAPVLASAVIAYLLEGVVVLLGRRGVPRGLSSSLVFVVFIIFLTLILFGLMPLLSRQVTQLVQQLPTMISAGQQALMALPEHYPDIISPAQVQDLLELIRQEVASFGQQVLSVSLASVIGVLTIVVYLVLMPLLIFFFLKDKVQILAWFSRFMPEERSLAVWVWAEVDKQITNYMNGKFWEILIVSIVSFIVFISFGLQYAMLLAVLVGLSVVIPFLGATLVTIPVLLVAWFQWGWGPDFIWLTVAYFVVQILDGNLLVPVLFSEAVNLHPVAIIVAILVFGGLWGLWGVFFAIPLATLVNAILHAWPQQASLEIKH
jgi:putative permease